jgi:hypothetical protein
LTLAEGFTPPPGAAKTYHIMPVSVGTDPGLATKTRRGTGYYKVPSLKGVWYRMFGHSGWCVPTGFIPYGAKTYAVKGHPLRAGPIARGQGGINGIPEDALAATYRAATVRERGSWPQRKITSRRWQKASKTLTKRTHIRSGPANITHANSVILPKGGVLVLLRLVFLATVTLSGRLVFAEDIKAVLAASRRAGYVEFYDPTSLQTIGRIRVGALAESVVASPEGHRLFVAQALPADEHGCCALFALDLSTRSLCPLIEPALEGAVSPDGPTVFVNRGSVGIDLIDTTTSLRNGKMEGPGNYCERMFPSPDGRWVFAATMWRGPSLDIFDLAERRLVRRLKTPGAESLSGAWIGEKFYLYAQYLEAGRLWQVTSDTTELGPGVSVTISGLSSCSKIPALMTMIATRDRIFVYEPFGFKLDRLNECGNSILGGSYALDPSSGDVIAHLSPSLYFMRLVACNDNHELIGLDARGPVRLVKLDSKTGNILAERILEEDVYNLAVANIAESVLPRGEVEAVSCDRH